jgi:two-component sensor histidine kinase
VRTAAALLERQVASVTGVQFAIHDAVRVRISEIAPEAVSGFAFHRFLRSLHDTAPRGVAIGVTAVDGRLLASSHEYPPVSYVGGRDYQRLIRDGQEKVVDRIFLERGKIDSLVTATAVTVGTTPAVVVTGWAVDDIGLFMRDLAAFPGREAMVFRADGRVLLDTGQPGTATMPPDDPLLDAIAAHAAGEADLPAAGGDLRRLAAYSAVQGIPLIVAYDVAVPRLRAEWLRRAAPVWAFLAVAGAAGFVLVGAVQASVAARLRHAAERERAEAAERLATYRSDLVREMNHRIKNNLAIVASLIRFDARRKGQLDAAEVTGRINAVAAVHDMLYRADDGMVVDLGLLLEAIATNPAVVPAESGIAVTLDVAQDVALDSRVATTLAMIVAEIVTNAVKHAFADTPDPRIALAMRKERDGRVEIVLRDNGPGLPAEPGRRSGSDLVTALATGVGVAVEVRNDGGTVYRLSLVPEAADGPGEERPREVKPVARVAPTQAAPLRGGA